MPMHLNISTTVNFIMNTFETDRLHYNKSHVAGIMPIGKLWKPAFSEYSSSFQKLVSTLQLKEMVERTQKRDANGDTEEDSDVVCFSCLLLCDKPPKIQGLKTTVVYYFSPSVG